MNPSDELVEIAARLGWVADDGSEVAVTDRMKDGWRQVARDMLAAAHDAGLIVYRDEYERVKANLADLRWAYEQRGRQMLEERGASSQLQRLRERYERLQALNEKGLTRGEIGEYRLLCSLFDADPSSERR